MEQARVDLTIIIRIAFLTFLLTLWGKTCQLVLYAAYPTARLCSTISFAVNVTKNSWQVQPAMWEMNIILLTRVPRAFFNIDSSRELASNASCAYVPLSFSRFSRSRLFMFISRPKYCFFVTSNVMPYQEDLKTCHAKQDTGYYQLTKGREHEETRRLFAVRDQLVIRYDAFPDFFVEFILLPLSVKRFCAIGT